jgi:uncharacterized protein YjdB
MGSSEKLIPEMDGLVEKFTELLTGEATDTNIEMVKAWALYSHMLKVMPSLVKHWTSEEQHQDAKLKIRNLFEEIQQMNEQNKTKMREQQAKLNQANRD